MTLNMENNGKHNPIKTLSMNALRHGYYYILGVLSFLIGAKSLAGNNDNGDPSRLLILGLGRVGLQCGLLASQTSVVDHAMGTVRSGVLEHSHHDHQDGIERIPFLEAKKHWHQATHVLWTIPLVPEKDESLHQVLELLQTDNDHLQWIGMVSTTGVYGNHDGNWVTEDSALLCTSDSNAALYQEVEDMFGKVGGQIFRCAGIYDSTRSALHTVCKTRLRPEPMDSNDKSITNRIHTMDIARAIVSSMKLSTTGSSSSNNNRLSRIYNVADDKPAGRSKVLNYAADLLESRGISMESPTVQSLDSADASRPVTKRERRRLVDRKLVSNQRMKTELLQGQGLLYPTYKEGLQAILEDPTTPWQVTR